MIRPSASDHVLVVFSHPSEESFTAAARDRVLAGLSAAGRTVRIRDLYAEAWETEGDESAHAADLAWCDTLVLVYPTWWSGQPGMLSDWIVRCWPDTSRRRHLRRIAAVSSHGSAKYVNALEGETGKHLLERWIRRRCHRLARVDWIPFYGIDTSTDAERAAFLDSVERRFATRY